MSRKQRILVIDNYDSFTFNLVQLLGMSRQEVIVYKNDDLSTKKLKSLKVDKILISPGPGRPEDSKASLTAIETFYSKIPILGVCLGHQAIGIVLGCKVIRAPDPVHGKTSLIYHDRQKIFKGIRSPFSATRYHSLLVDKSSLTAELEITAETEEGLIMGMHHKNYPLEGIQFHPESILTRVGVKIIRNWLAE